MKAKDPLQAKFANAHHYLLLNETSKCINAYSGAVGSIINDTKETGSSAIVAEISLLDKFRDTTPKLANQIKLYQTIAMYQVTEDSDRDRSINHLERYKIRKEPFKTSVVIVAGGA